MEILRILIAAFMATTVMTFLSYSISADFKELYKEPLLLKYLLSRWGIALPDRLKEALAWGIHYAIGLFFVIGYDFLWDYKIILISWVSGVGLGIVSGILGILGWEAMFTLSGYTSKIDIRGFYIQLFFVHIAFALTAVAVYKVV
jgi:hypothetical protein